MGEVYRARDHELHRSVALKLLSDEFASNPDRVKRLIQEARAASALNHPNIITVYEIGRTGAEENSPPFIATELIDGVTLREYVSHKKIKLGEVLDITIQIASALVAAHEDGIVHRDIKQDNIMVRRDGYIKVLDFGLAKPVETVMTAPDSEAQTRALVKTERGALMGTVSYMSPEQARGLELDHRTDLWSLGAVLYEMLTGRPPFRGETASHIIVSILEDEPLPLATYVADVPEALEWIVIEALTKDRAERTQTAREMLSKLRRLKQRIDAGVELERSLDPSISAVPISSQSGRGQTLVQPMTTARSGEFGSAPVSSAEYIVSRIQTHKKGISLALVVAGLAVAGLIFGVYKLATRKRSPAATSLKISRLTNDGKSQLGVISPDGKYVAHIFQSGDKQSLILRQTASASSREIVPPVDGYFLAPTFSLDGNYLYYVKGDRGGTTRSLYQVSVLGGDSRQLLYDIDSAVAFSPDSKRLAFIRVYPNEQSRVLLLANADGTGEERLVTLKNPPIAGIFSPVWSPDGNRIAFVESGDDAQGYYVNIDEVDVHTRALRKISADRWRLIDSIAWLPDGDGLVATARDRESVAGSPAQIWHVSYPDGKPARLTNDLNAYEDLSVAMDARNAVASVRSLKSTVVVAPNGNSEQGREVLSSNSAGVEGVSWTTDGRVLYTAVARDNRDIWVMNADGSGQKQLTFDVTAELYPVASPDGRYIVFESNRGGHWGIWRMNADGSGAIELVRNDGEFGVPQFSPDSRLVYYSANSEGKSVVWKTSIDGGSPTRVNNQQMHSLAVSPDGKLLAFYFRLAQIEARLQIQIISAETGAPVKTFPLVGDGGKLRWSPDGKSLDYIETHEGISNLWRMPIESGKPRQLTNWKSELIYWFAWTLDGKQLACARGSSTTDLVLIEGLEGK